MDSLPISADFEAISEAFKRTAKIDFEELSLHHLDLTNILDCFLNIEGSKVCPEFASLQLGIIKDVVDEEAQNLRT